MFDRRTKYSNPSPSEPPLENAGVTGMDGTRASHGESQGFTLPQSSGEQGIGGEISSRENSVVVV